jgi:hypothetical protein
VVKEGLGTRLMRLNGWQRIGLVTSIVWFIAGGLWGNKIALDEAGARTSLQLDACVAENKRRHGEYGPHEQVTVTSSRNANISCMIRPRFDTTSAPSSRLRGASPGDWGTRSRRY